MNLVCVFGGTFDPIHYGHLRPVAQVAERVGCTSVHFVPAARPPHREPPLASAEHRLAMLRLALAGLPTFIADDRELRRDGPSYTFDTLQTFRFELGAEHPLGLIVGLDAFLGMTSWHRWRRIPDQAHLIVMQRPGWLVASAGDVWWRESECDSAAELAERPAGNVYFVPVDPVEISATSIRAHLRDGEDIRRETPPAVAQYIQQHGLYQ